jgi:hypothetical protein
LGRAQEKSGIGTVAGIGLFRKIAPAGCFLLFKKIGFRLSPRHYKILNGGFFNLSIFSTGNATARAGIRGNLRAN